MTDTFNIKAIAFFLPQYHPIPENDEWWGKGFTEWTNVAQAQPLFPDHYQPHIPADLGFYDLRLPEARQAQADLARQYGIYGFCYYHYWFNGKRMLHEPLDRKLQNPREDLPFMLCWANENWTRTWDGLENEVLLKQEYSLEDDKRHFEFLCKTYFSDERYIKHKNKPVFLVYQPNLFKNINKTIKLWRKVAIENGIGEIHLGYMQSWGLTTEPNTMGFDFAVEFQPKFPQVKAGKTNISDRIFKKLNLKNPFHDLNNQIVKDKIFDYEKFIDIQINNKFVTNVSPCILPMWDNSSRKTTKAFIFTDGTPDKYKKWLTHIITLYPWRQNSEKYLFINAWNEWAEGNHLEPCQKWGTKYLEVTKEALNENGNQN